MKNKITKLMALAALCTTLTGRAADLVTVEGVLYTHVAAIGGETTGIVVQHDDGKTTDLKINDPQMLKLADSLEYRRVIASGPLTIVHGVEIPERRVVEAISLAAVNRDVVCKSNTTDYRLEISLEKKTARVLKGTTSLSQLKCIAQMTFPVKLSCYEPMMADAGYQATFTDTSGVVPHAELYEVFIWGRKLLDKLTCLN